MLSADAAYVPLVCTTRAYIVKPYLRGTGANNLLERPWAEIRSWSTDETGARLRRS
jgi:hypothetical protein